ncbi:DUF305 domain-containing protein [Xanthobacter sp. DSM 24535]|uniref:DUF305 domain-containing protein n=1 Tax=Roseixanthobacter psychrophilus TaxID=3119917 RepID=UPI00372663AB
MRIRTPSLAVGLVALAAACAAGSFATQAHDAAPAVSGAAQPTDEAPFLTENAAAMDKMMADMDVKPTGDVDADFAAMMIPHHQGAVDMAVAYLRYGRNEQLRRLAQEIVVEQQQEIAAMRLALGQPLPPSAPAPTQPVAVMPAAIPVHDLSAESHSTMSHSAMSHGSMTMPAAMPMSTK